MTRRRRSWRRSLRFTRTRRRRGRASSSTRRRTCSRATAASGARSVWPKRKNCTADRPAENGGRMVKKRFNGVERGKDCRDQRHRPKLPAGSAQGAPLPPFPPHQLQETRVSATAMAEEALGYGIYEIHKFLFPTPFRGCSPKPHPRNSRAASNPQQGRLPYSQPQVGPDSMSKWARFACRSPQSHRT